MLVRYNPEGDKALNQRQAARLKQLSDYLHENDRPYMFELLVPAEKAQLERLGGDKKAYDLRLRPALMVRAIHELQDAGVEADVWKIEGIERGRIAGRSSRPPDAAAATESAASFWGAARTSRRCASG